jgi:glycosyltransferase involved in cell wall biosynthesis
MKIFYFIDSMGIGGSEGQVAEVGKRLVAAGHTVVIGCIHLNGPNIAALKAAGVDFVEFPVPGSLMGVHGITAIVRLWRYIRRSKFDVVHTHDLYSNLVAVPAAWLAGTKSIVSSRRDLASWWWYTPRNRRILRWIQLLSHTVVANSQGVKNFLVDQDGFRPNHVRVIRNAVDSERFVIGAKREKVFPMWSNAHKVFVVVANMHTHTKGHLHLIDAASRIIAKHTEARFALVGDGALREQLQSKVTALGLSNYFEFLGARTDIPSILAAADAAILPSLAEGLPNAVLEYLAAGKAVIASSVGGIPEVIRHQRNGLLIEPGSSDAIVEAVDYILDNPSEARRLADQGRYDAQHDFSFDRLIPELERLYGLPVQSVKPA